MKEFAERNLDLLQNLEFCIVEVYRADRTLLDIDALDAVDALARHYHAEEQGHTAPERKLSERAERVFQSVQTACEWRLGRGSFRDEPPIAQPTPVADLVKGLREIQKSIPRWSKRSGRRGYLDFVIDYMP